MEILLEYGFDLSLKQAEERYIEATTQFERVKSNYSGFSSLERKSIGEEDERSLINCIRVLLPFATENLDQKQVEQTKGFEGTLRYKIGELNVEILEYLENFKNSRKERFWG